MKVLSKCISPGLVFLHHSLCDNLQPSSRPLPKMPCLRQLRDGRCVISCSICSCSLGRLDRACTWSSSLRTPPLRHALPFLQFLTPDVADSFDFRHASFRSRSDFPFGLAAFTHFFHVLVHASLLKTEFIFGSWNLTVLVACVLGSVLSCMTNTPFLLLIGILWPVLLFSIYESEHDDVASINYRIHRRQRSQHVRMQESYDALLAVPTKFQFPSSSTCIGLQPLDRLFCASVIHSYQSLNQQ